MTTSQNDPEHLTPAQADRALAEVGAAALLDWRSDPDLVRQDDDLLDPDPELSEQWSGIFDQLVPSIMGRAGSGPIGMGLKLLVFQARRFVARNPEQARATVIQAIRMTVAQLHIEPGEVYDHE